MYAVYAITNIAIDSKTTEVHSIDLYTIALFLGFCKFYSNLEVNILIREYTNHLAEIVKTIYPFSIIIIIFIICFSNIFYVTGFYHDDEGANTYLAYVRHTYNHLFANWDPGSPRRSHFEWVNFWWVISTMVFAIMIFNILIAMVTDHYAKLSKEAKKTDVQNQ